MTQFGKKTVRNERKPLEMNSYNYNIIIRINMINK